MSLLDRSHGQKSILFIRAAFPDHISDPLPTDAELNGSAATANTDLTSYSYSQLSLQWTVMPGTVTLPHPVSYYSDIDHTLGPSAKAVAILNDAHSLAAAIGYDYSTYDMNFVYLSQWYDFQLGGYGTHADFLSPATLFNNPYFVEYGVIDFTGVMPQRADAWLTTDGTPFGCPTCGSVLSNGDPFDVKGTEQSQANFNIYHKNQEGWIPSANIQNVSASGTYRIYAQDSESSITPGRYYGLRVPGHLGQEYWIEYRQNQTGTQDNGLLINWGGLLLLDMHPGSSRRFDDAPLAPGQVFMDPEGVSISLTAAGGTTPRWTDVAVMLPNSPKVSPGILTEADSDRAIAVNAETFVRDPFTIFTEQNFGPDRHTRVMFFLANLSLMPGDDPSMVTVQAEDDLLNTYPLAVEAVGSVSGFDWLTRVSVRLPDELANAGDVRVSVSYGGVTSNRARITIH